MIHTERMNRVTIVAPKHYMESIINKLYECGAYHIEEHKKTEQLDIGTPLEKGGKIAEILVKIRALLSQLNTKQKEGAHHKKPRHFTSKEYSDIDKKITQLSETVSQLIRQQK